MKTLIKKGKSLSKKELDLIVNANIKNFNDCQDYEKELRLLKNEEVASTFFFVEKKGKIVSMGLLRPIKINYLRKSYNIFGISNMISIIKRKGYGKMIVSAMKEFLQKKSKTGVGFCHDGNIRFYKKSGLSVLNKSKNRFFYDYGNPKENKEMMEDAVIYFEGKDKFITKVLKTKSLIKISCEHW